MLARPPALVLSDQRTPRVERIAAAIGAHTGPLADARRASRGAQVVFAFASVDAFPSLVLQLLSLRARALIVAPIGEPGPLPTWNAPIARFCFPSQAAARRWFPHIPLGRLVVIEPGPAPAPTADGVYVATAEDALDPEPIIAAAAAGAAIVSPIPHAALPPGAVIAADAATARAALQADATRRHALGIVSRDWAAKGRSTADEAAAIQAIVAEVRSMATRGGRTR